MPGQQQHVELYRKINLRKSFLKYALPGAAYVPFIGDGDIAVALYSDRAIWGADIDPARVATAQSRLPSAHIVVGDCDGWPFSEDGPEFSVADLDAYCNPYQSLAAFWARARKASRVIIFGTDGMKQGIARRRRAVLLPSGNPGDDDWRTQYAQWWVRHVLPHVTQVVTPYCITRKMFYCRKWMLYWAVVCEQSCQALP
jgi:hypothetical protein